MITKFSKIMFTPKNGTEISLVTTAGVFLPNTTTELLINAVKKTILKPGKVLDLGCGTGTSTRRLAKIFPQANKVMGMDLSPYFIHVGKMLLDLSPRGQNDGGPWVTTIDNDGTTGTQNSCKFCKYGSVCLPVVRVAV